MLVVLLIVAGDQVPTIPLGAVLDKSGAVEPEQKAGIGAKLGVQFVGGVAVHVKEAGP